MSILEAYNEIQNAAREGRISKIDLIGIGEELISFAIGREVKVSDFQFLKENVAGGEQ